MTAGDDRTPAPPARRSRAERLAEALRANLGRRKAQGRARSAGSAAATDGAAPPVAAGPCDGLDFAPVPGDKDGEAEAERR